MIQRPVLMVGTAREEYIMQKMSNTQPQLLCFGTWKTPSQFFILVDQHAISCETNLVSAVDKLFKFHFVFTVEYAAKLQLFNKFLETFVYSLASSGKARCKTRLLNLLLT